jgi:hypothetical protein
MGVLTGVVNGFSIWRRFLRSFDNGRAPVSRLVLVAPSHDGLTLIMKDWILDLAAKQAGALELLVDDDVTPSNIDSALTRFPEGGVLVVFYGHGMADCFLTGPKLGGARAHLDGHSSVLCTSTSIARFPPVRVVAYCCDAALVMGREVRQSHRLSGFLGFKGKPYFVFGSTRREESFREPFAKVLASITAAGSLLSETDLQRLRLFYLEEHEKWCMVSEREDSLNLLVGACLMTHLQALDDTV